MTKIAYIKKRFARGSLDMIEKANEIIVSYKAQGYNLTLRQVYYQFVSRDLIKNKQSEYKRLGSIINDARLAGLISWDAIEDRTRNLRKFYFSYLDTPANILRSAADGHEVDHWADQKNYAEVWIEKDALVGVIERTCNQYRVPYFACRGYNSQSEQWNAGMRLKRKMAEGKKVHILHLGDHDPSGIDMTSDNTDRLSMFAGKKVNLHRLALNMDQVEQYDPPPNPAKETDKRFEKYFKEYGGDCWELDALEPDVINSIVEDKIKTLIDNKVWQLSDDRQAAEASEIYHIAERLENGEE